MEEGIHIHHQLLRPLAASYIVRTSHLYLHIRPSLQTNSYNTHRRGLRRLLFGDTMKNAISQFTQLENMEVTMYDDGWYYVTGSWWKDQITAEIPSLSDVLSVKMIYKTPRMYAYIYHTPCDCSLTWKHLTQ